VAAVDMAAFEPVLDELDLSDFEVIGEIPRELNGSLVRNGPNPLSGQFESEDVLSWWPEAAMLHSVSLADGKAIGYRNRWVRTQAWANHKRHDATATYPETNPNINVISHGGEILALAEGGQPLVINRSLDTLGASLVHPSLHRGMTAHPKVDPVTQELMYFKADWQAPWLRYGVADANGVEILDLEIDVPAPAMMHDMAITETHSILMDLSVGYDFAMFELGYRIPICWQDARASRLCVIPRHGGEVCWIEIDPCFIQHVVNAYNDSDGTIVMDVVRYPSYFKRNRQGDGFSPNPLGVLWRYRINLATVSVTEAQMDDQFIELPRINETLTGRRHRFFYGLEQPADNIMRGVIRYDMSTGAKVRHHVAEGDQNSEPVFVPRDTGTAEDDGWLLVCVYRKQTNTSELRILDAGDISAEPCATIKLGSRIPAGFHGAWLPES
tara:strand:- start:33780 stop:35102 length:1323 start_codon:yes stop_codon:yes gene_type:complete